MFFDKIAYSKYLPEIKTNHPVYKMNHPVYIHTYEYCVTSTFSIALTLFHHKEQIIDIAFFCE